MEVRADLAGDRDVGRLEAGHIRDGWSGVPWETRDRLRAAILNSGEQWPTSILLASRPAPAIPSLLDAAFAVAVLSAAEVLPRRRARLAMLGELGLDGRLRAGAGQAATVAAAASAFSAAGVRYLVVPAALASLPADSQIPSRPSGHAELVGVKDLTELVALLRSGDVRPATGAPTLFRSVLDATVISGE